MVHGYLSAPVYTGVTASAALRGGARHVRVMTYNLNWRSFHTPGATKRVYMMARFISGYMPDVLCLQEIRHDVEWPMLSAALSTIMPDFVAMYTVVAARAGNGGIMTLFKSRLYQLKSTATMTGDFLTRSDRVTSGRPYCVIVLQNKVNEEQELWVANVHFPHAYELAEGDTMARVYRTLESALTRAGATELSHTLIAGDFNHDAATERTDFLTGDEPILLGMFSSTATFPTYFDVSTRTFTRHLDFILNSWEMNGDEYEYKTIHPQEQALLTSNQELLMSDHLPVMAAIPLDWPSARHPFPPISIPQSCMFLAHVTDKNPASWTELRLGTDNSDGAYCLLVTTHTFERTVVFSATRFDMTQPWYLILLPIDVLAHGNYHVNVIDQMGQMNPFTTYMPWELSEVVKQLHWQSAYVRDELEDMEELQTRPFAEVVFSRPVQLKPNCFVVRRIDPPHDKLRLLSTLVPRSRYKLRTECTFFDARGDTPFPTFSLNVKPFYDRFILFYNTIQEMDVFTQNLYVRTLLAAFNVDASEESEYMDAGQFNLEAVKELLDEKLELLLSGQVEPRVYEWLEWMDFQRTRHYQLLTSDVQRYLGTHAPGMWTDDGDDAPLPFRAYLQKQGVVSRYNSEGEVLRDDLQKWLDSVDANQARARKRERDE
jgi:endonuclease/exonuclease/phosphatase family metal-dependent hydrolase